MTNPSQGLRYRTLRERAAFSWKRWSMYALIAVLFAIACGFLANWQISRSREANQAITTINHNYDATPVPLEQVLPRTTSYRDSDEWRQVSLSGEYQSDRQLLVRDRTLGGHPGFEVLVPFRLDSGEIFIVDRGYVPTGNAQDHPDHIPAAPNGHASVVVRIQGGEPQVGNRSAGHGQVATIHLPTISRMIHEPMYSKAYGLMVSENPAPTEAAPHPLPKPEVDEGLHVSYAIQWVIFGVAGIVGLFWGIRHERKAIRGEIDEGDVVDMAAPSIMPRRRKKVSDLEEEEAEIGD